MKIFQKIFQKTKGWQNIGSFDEAFEDVHLVLAFASTELLENSQLIEEIRTQYPKAQILMGSTAGEIIDDQVYDNSLSLTAIQFEKTLIKSHQINIKDAANSYDAGQKLATLFDKNGLVSLFVLSDGQLVNGSDLVDGIQSHMPPEVIITGGLAGDGKRFQTTRVGLNEMPLEGRIAAIGFYGSHFKVSFGSAGGWDAFGPERLITKSKDNILYELDHKPALDVYKMYLGDYSSELPSAGLLFPLSLRGHDASEPIIRTILAVNEKDKSLTFAGNMPQGTYAKLMKADFDRLIQGAAEAARNSIKKRKTKPELAILISCVGRKLVLNQRIDEEIEEIKAVFGNNTAIAGFYSYGEISPENNFLKCEFHNQTMTVTTFYES